MRDAFRKARLKKMVEDTDTWQGRTFDHVVKSLIVFSIVSYSIETLPDLSARIQRLLYVLEVTVVIIFTAEYALRIYVTDRKLAYIFSPLGIIDLLAILPFYILPGGADSRAVRAMRLLRIARTLKLVRYNQAVDRLLRAVVIAREEIVLFFSLTIISLYLAASGIHFFESEVQPDKFGSIFHGLWWAVVTLTTVGYGDVYPVTTGGRLFTFLILMIGMGIIAVPPGIISSALSKARQEQDKADESTLSKQETEAQHTKMDP
jgi:voltage-gated potassium channel